MNFIIRWLVTAVAVGVAVWLVPGMELLGGTDAWAGIAIFGLILASPFAIFYNTGLFGQLASLGAGTVILGVVLALAGGVITYIMGEK